MKLKCWKNVFHMILNANLIVEHIIQIKNGIIKHASMNVKITVSAKEIIPNPSTCICEN